MKKFALMMIASMAMAMTMSLTSCFDKTNNTEGGDSTQSENTEIQAEDSIPAGEEQMEEVPAEVDNMESAE